MTAASVQICAQERLGNSTLYHLTVKSFVGVKEVKNKTYSDFQELHKVLTKDKLPVPQLPPKTSKAGDKKKRLNAIARQVHQTEMKEMLFEVMFKRCRGLESMLNEMMGNPNIAGHPRLCSFVETTPDIALYGFKQMSTQVPPQQPQNFEGTVATPPPQTMLPLQAMPILPQDSGQMQSFMQQLPDVANQSRPMQPNTQQLPDIMNTHTDLPPQGLRSQRIIPNETPPPTLPQVPEHEVHTSDLPSQDFDPYHPNPTTILEQYTPPHSGLRLLEQYSPIVRDIEVPAGLEGYTEASPAAMVPNEISFGDHRAVSHGTDHTMVGMSAITSNNVMSASTVPSTPSPARGFVASPQGKLVVRSGSKDRVLSTSVYEGQYTGNDEEIVGAWIEELTQERLQGPLQDALKSGVVLCKLVNRIQPKTIKRINNSSMPFPQRENIKAFCDAARELGVPDSENFNTDDLFERRNFKQVLICLFSLGRQCYYVQGYEGPALGRPEKAQLGAANDSKFEVKADALWGKGNSQFKAADGRPSSGQVTKGSLGSLGHSPLRP